MASPRVAKAQSRPAFSSVMMASALACTCAARTALSRDMLKIWRWISPRGSRDSTTDRETLLDAFWEMTVKITSTERSTSAARRVRYRGSPGPMPTPYSFPGFMVKSL